MVEKKQELFTLLLLSFLFIFQACISDDDNTPPPADNKYLTGVTAEQRFTKAKVIEVLNTVLPGLDINSKPLLAMLITDVDVYLHIASTGTACADMIEAARAKWGNSTLEVLSSEGHFASGMEFMLKYMGFWDLIQP